MDDLVEIERAQSDWQFEGLVLIVVHDGIIMTLDTRGQEGEYLDPSEDVLEPHLYIFEAAQQEVQTQIEQVAQRQEVLVPCRVLIILLGGLPLSKGKGNACEVCLIQ